MWVNEDVSRSKWFKEDLLKTLMAEEGVCAFFDADFKADSNERRLIFAGVRVGTDNFDWDLVQEKAQQAVQAAEDYINGRRGGQGLKLRQ